MAEKTIDKYFIKPDGGVSRCWPEHQLFAWDYLGRKVTQKLRAKSDAENLLKTRGWIRVQIYSDEGLGLEGRPEYLRRNGQNILEVLPNPRRVYVQPWPIARPGGYFSVIDLERLGWNQHLHKRQMRALFAAMLRQLTVKAEAKGGISMPRDSQ